MNFIQNRQSINNISHTNSALFYWCTVHLFNWVYTLSIRTKSSVSLKMTKLLSTMYFLDLWELQGKIIINLSTFNYFTLRGWQLLFRTSDQNQSEGTVKKGYCIRMICGSDCLIFMYFYVPDLTLKLPSKTLVLHVIVAAVAETQTRKMGEPHNHWQSPVYTIVSSLYSFNKECLTMTTCYLCDLHFLTPRQRNTKRSLCLTFTDVD